MFRTRLSVAALAGLLAAAIAAPTSANEGRPTKKQTTARKYAEPRRCNGCPPPFAPAANARATPQDGVKGTRYGGLKERPIPQ